MRIRSFGWSRLQNKAGDGHGTTLVVSDGGLLAIGIEPVAVKTKGASRGGASAQPDVKHPTLRTETTQALRITMLRRAEGAAMPQTIAATGWQAHSARGALLGALGKKLGLEVVSAKVDARGRVYRIGQSARPIKLAARTVGHAEKHTLANQSTVPGGRIAARRS